MASTKDIHDIMGMGGGPVQKPANKKKKKAVEAQPRLSGISREVQALMGDSVPPVQIVDAPKYKAKPSLASKLYRPRHWAEREFTPGARPDGLVLRHWKRAQPLQKPQPPNGDTEMIDGEKSDPPSKSEYQYEDEFAMEKWNVSIRVPQYTDEQYEKHFNTDEWTKEETDHLMRLASDYDLRWILISDRYEPQEIKPVLTEANGSEIATTYPPRTMEQLKLRYYQVAAQDLEMRTPKSNMNPTEFQLWEKMRNFDAKTESQRKAMAEKLFERTKDEAEEERTLLEELHRITKNEEDFVNMRRDLYTRLEAAPSLRRNERGEEQNIVLSSAGISDLLSRLFAKEKHMKRRTLPTGETSAPATQTPVDTKGRQSTVQRRDTLETPTTETSKKGSISAPVPKQLSKADEEKYGVIHSTERLTSGVSFRHEKINRVTTAKSQVQTQKINAALTELEIPARLSMPTEKVCKEFERLVSQIQLLLDARKTLTRVSEEVKTLEEIKRQRLGEAAPAQDEAAKNDATVTGKASDPSEQHHEAQLQKAVGAQARSTETPKAEDAAKDDGEPGPAVDEDDEDAEDEDAADVSNIEKTQMEDDEEQDDTNANDESMAQRTEADDDEDEAENQEDDVEAEAEQEDDEEEEDEEEEDEDDDEGMQALRRGVENGDKEDEQGDEDEDDDAGPDAEEDEDEDEQDNEDSMTKPNTADSDDEDDAEDDTQDVTMNEVEQADDDPDVEDSRPAVAGSRAAAGHKRGASVLSDASGAGSNRSGVGRKRRR